MVQHDARPYAGFEKCKYKAPKIFRILQKVYERSDPCHEHHESERPVLIYHFYAIPVILCHMLSLYADMIALNALRHELQRYDEECRIARQWKPEGPTKEEDRTEYLASQSEIPLAEVLRLGRPVLTTICHKYRVKHGLFRRTGFHKVFLVVRERFLYYFDSDEPKAKSLGAAYVFGADVLQLHEVLDGKKFLLRVVPSVPRKPSKSEMGATEENNLLLGFDTEKQMSELLHVLLQLSVPKCPESVAEHLKRESCKDVTE